MLVRTFLLLLLTYPALAQLPDSVSTDSPPDPAELTHGWVSDLSVGSTIGINNVPAYQTFLATNRIEASPGLALYLNIGGVGYRYRRFRLMTQVLYSVIFEQVGSQRTGLGFVSRKIAGGGFGLLAGYDLVNDRNRRLYLNLGAGRVGQEHSIYNRSRVAIPFSQLPKATQTGAIPSLQIVNTYWEISLDYCQREKRKRSAGLTVRAGYRRGFRPQPWTSDAFTLTDAPTDRISQFFMQLGYQFSTNYTKKRARP